MIYLLVKQFTFFTGVEVTIGKHRCVDAFGILHAKFLHAILEVFLPRDEIFILLLPDLKTEENIEFSYHEHSIFFGHHLAKFFVVTLVSTTEDNIVHICTQINYHHTT